MARFVEFTPEMEVEHAAWLASRPESVQKLALRYPPNVLYRLKTTGQRYSCISYAEEGTVRVLVQPRFNPMQFFPLEVFGIDPADLEECDVPAPGSRPWE